MYYLGFSRSILGINSCSNWCLIFNCFVLSEKRMSVNWNDSEKADELDRCFQKWQSLKECFKFLLEKTSLEVDYEKEMDIENSRRMVPGFLEDFTVRLNHVFSLFIVRKPFYGEPYHDFVDRLRPILDDYVRLNDEFNSNRLV